MLNLIYLFECFDRRVSINMFDMHINLNNDYYIVSVECTGLCYILMKIRITNQKYDGNMPH